MHSLSHNDVGYLDTRQSFFSLPGLLVVLVFHGALFYFLMSQKLIPPPENMVTLFAEIVKPPAPKQPPKVKTEPKPVKLQPVKKPKPPKPKKRRIVSKAPVQTKQEYVAPPPPPLEPEPEPEPEPAPAVPQIPTGPVMLSSELSVSCPELAAPVYPSISRRMGEEGKLVLRVELDEKGRVDKARVATSSGYSRLDNAALETVRKWRCKPSTREGHAVRAVALQPFNFVLQGN